MTDGVLNREISRVAGKKAATSKSDSRYDISHPISSHPTVR